MPVHSAPRKWRKCSDVSISWSVCCSVVALGLAGAAPASAQGFGVYEQGACMMGRGGAGVADPCPDGSGVFFNPAALSFDTTRS